MGFQRKKKQFDASLYCADCSCLALLGGRRDQRCTAMPKALVCFRSYTFRLHWKLFFPLYPFLTVSVKDLPFLCIEDLRPYDPHLLSWTPWIGFQYFPTQVLLYSSLCLTWSSGISLLLFVPWQDAIPGVCVCKDFSSVESPVWTLRQKSSLGRRVRVEEC